MAVHVLNVSYETYIGIYEPVMPVPINIGGETIHPSEWHTDF